MPSSSTPAAGQAVPAAAPFILAPIDLAEFSISQLAGLARQVEKLADHIRDVAERGVFVRPSKQLIGLSDPTSAGEKMDVIVAWLDAQREAIIAELQQRSPANRLELESKADALCWELAAHGWWSELAKVAADAAAELEPQAA